jgi:protein-tyrosine-phosphatase/predicted ATP-grasp superfamily ATP-dependent carboligase
LKALVLDADSRAGLESIQSLARHDVSVDASSEIDCLAFGSKRVHEHFRQPSTVDASIFLQWLRDLDREAGYSLIIPSTEGSLRPFMLLPESDPLRKKAVLASNAALESTLDKSLTLQVASSVHLPVPKGLLITSEDSIPLCSAFPVVLKPVSSQIHAGDRIKQVQPLPAGDDLERRELLHDMLRDSAVLQQELVPGHGVGIAMLYNQGKRVWFFGHERLHEGSGRDGLGSGSTYRRSIKPDPEMLRRATDLLDKLKWHGIAMVEYKVSDDGKYWFMEINPRLWGSLALAIDAGVDFPYGLLCLATGQSIPAQPDYKIGYTTRWLIADLDWLRHRLLHRPDTGAAKEILKLVRPIFGCESWDYFDWGDLWVTTSDIRLYISGKISSQMGKVDAERQARAARNLHVENLQRFQASGQRIQKILFLCYGNICRSPAAELLMQKRFPELEVLSAGFYPDDGRSSTPQFQEVAKDFSIDLSNWSSRRVSMEMVRDADVIFLHDARNYGDFCTEFSDFKDKVLMLGMFLDPPSLEIQDPYDFGSTKTRQVLQEISAAIDAMGSKLFASPRGGIARY